MGGPRAARHDRGVRLKLSSPCPQSAPLSVQPAAIWHDLLWEAVRAVSGGYVAQWLAPRPRLECTCPEFPKVVVNCQQNVGFEIHFFLVILLLGLAFAAGLAAGAICTRCCRAPVAPRPFGRGGVWTGTATSF